MFWKNAFEPIENEGEGVYNLMNLRLGNYENELYLGTTTNTHYKRSDEIIEKTKERIQRRYRCVQFPPSDIRNIMEFKNCPKCKKQLVPMSLPELLQCPTCKLTKLKENVPSSYVVSMYFE